MIIIGIDAHKKTHTAVAVDEVGRQLAQITVKATSEGHLRLVAWAARFEARRFAIEDCRHLTRRLEADLLVAGEAAVRVHPRLMAAERRGGRQRGKSDPIDALAVARAALREPGLPVVEMDTETREIRLLSDHRDNLVRERTALSSRLRWHLHELAPEFAIRSRGLKAASVCERVAIELARHDGLVAELASEVLARIVELNRRITEIELRLRPLVVAHSPSLLAVPGCGVMSAAKIIGETARAGRFSSKDAYARFNGTPRPCRCGHPTTRRSASPAAATDRSTPRCT